MMSNKIFGTETSEGIIPHKRFKGIDCPVRLVAAGKRLMFERSLPIPERDSHGNLVFVLPGGGSLCHPYIEKRAA